jgi:hypothetical protein
MDGKQHDIRRRFAQRVNENAAIEPAAPTEATLNELAEKLSALREHLEQVVAALHDPPGADRGLRCHGCGRTSPGGRAGWTLRLCGDDELHPFCPDCDRLHGDGDGRR